MALTWNWDKKMCKCTMKNGCELNLYRGNAFVIAIWESDKDDTYQLAWFFANKDHAKNCLGLTKGYDNIQIDWDTFELDTSYKETEQFVQLLAKAKEKVTIKLY